MKTPTNYALTSDDLTKFNQNAPAAAYDIIDGLGWPEAVTMSWMGTLMITYFTQPSAHRDLLVNQPDAFHRDPRSERLFKTIMGESVFTSEGDVWRRRR
ncbi:MAG: hypothetical protein AAF125_02800, partial [Chloroflexota bacterium]